ncbi:hypothetical protein ADL03_27560 [Nocardia sp. NRRL S-836]|nr:hypothetical protein ADL03_27560 [Nocardia sp. NRRL S-836]
MVRIAYEHLRKQRILYDTAEIDFQNHSPVMQVIREPGQVKGGSGNCLDLTLIFAGLCQWMKLRPLVVLLERHALLAVMLDADVESVMEGRGGGNDYQLLHQGLLAPNASTDTLRRWADEKKCVLIECTGITDSSSYGRDFEAAVTAGEDAIRRGDVLNVVDVSFCHKNGHTPYLTTSGLQVTSELALGPVAVHHLRSRMARVNVVEPSQWHCQALRAVETTDRRLREELANLERALSAAEFAKEWLGNELTSRRLRSVLWLRSRVEMPTEQVMAWQDYFAHVALNHPSTETSGCAMVGYVLALGLDVGRRSDDTAFSAWAESVLDAAVVNDVRLRMDQRHRQAKLRLLLVLDASLTDEWPERVDAWLLDGDELREQNFGKCQPTQYDVETVVNDLVDWAALLVEEVSETLQRVDIAMPTALLTRWLPEEIGPGGHLGKQHDVVVRWGTRLNPPRHLRVRKSEIRGRWKIIEEQGPSAMWWLDHEQASDLNVVDVTLRTQHMGGMGLRFTPDSHAHLLELLLKYSPVLLWPNADLCAWQGVEPELERYWVSLPTALAEAYRKRWQGIDAPLATMRAVWDDPEWLTFCHKAQGRAGIA